MLTGDSWAPRVVGSASPLPSTTHFSHRLMPDSLHTCSYCHGRQPTGLASPVSMATETMPSPVASPAFCRECDPATWAQTSAFLRGWLQSCSFLYSGSCTLLASPSPSGAKKPQLFSVTPSCLQNHDHVGDSHASFTEFCWWIELQPWPLCTRASWAGSGGILH